MCPPTQSVLLPVRHSKPGELKLDQTHWSPGPGALLLNAGDEWWCLPRPWRRAGGTQKEGRPPICAWNCPPTASTRSHSATRMLVMRTSSGEIQFTISSSHVPEAVGPAWLTVRALALRSRRSKEPPISNDGDFGRCGHNAAPPPLGLTLQTPRARFRPGRGGCPFHRGTGHLSPLEA